MDKTIRVSIHNNYGRDVVYPVCADALRFAQIANTTTLTTNTITAIKKLGYQITVETPALNS